MALRAGCPVVAIFVPRVGPRRYRVLARRIPSPPGEGAERRLTEALAAEIERVVRLYPEQWAWNYKRWRDEV